MVLTRGVAVGRFQRIQYPPCSDDTEVCQVGGCAEGCDAAYAVQDELWGYDGTGCVCAVLVQGQTYRATDVFLTGFSLCKILRKRKLGGLALAEP